MKHSNPQPGKTAGLMATAKRVAGAAKPKECCGHKGAGAAKHLAPHDRAGIYPVK